MSQLTRKDIESKTKYLIKEFGLSADNEFRLEQLTDFCIRVGYTEGKIQTLHNLSKTITNELEKEQ